MMYSISFLPYLYASITPILWGSLYFHPSLSISHSFILLLIFPLPFLSPSLSIYLSLFLTLSLSFSLSLFLSFSLSVSDSLSVSLYLPFSVYVSLLFSLCVSLCHSLSLTGSDSLSVSVSHCLSVYHCLSVRPSVRPSACFFQSLSFYLYLPPPIYPPFLFLLHSFIKSDIARDTLLTEQIKIFLSFCIQFFINHSSRYSWNALYNYARQCRF